MILKVLAIIAVAGTLMSLQSCSAREPKRTKRFPVLALGSVTCDGRALPYVRVKLMDKIEGRKDRSMGRARTDGRGIFRIIGKLWGKRQGNPHPYIMVLFQYIGRYGKMEVENVFGVNRVGKSSTQRFGRKIDFGVINLSSITCRAYQQFMKAMIDYREETKAPLPYHKLHVQTNVVFRATQPLALTNTIRIPHNQKRITKERAMHDFAHTLRHSFDGNLAHFVRDFVRFGYVSEPTRNSHWARSCGRKSNNGLAFDEGWAKYWASTKCNKDIDAQSNDYRYEGNVVKAFFALEKKCKSNRAKMVEVLRKAGKRAIHSFKRFNQHHRKLFGCSL